jgi:hypothetical protein
VEYPGGGVGLCLENWMMFPISKDKLGVKLFFKRKKYKTN